MMNSFYSKSSSLEPLWTKDFTIITILNFLLYLGFQMLHPTLPVYAKHLGGNDAATGLILGIFALAAVLARPFTGLCSDLYGRKGVFLAGLAILIISIAAYLWAPTIGILLGIRFLHGLGWGTAGTASSTIASDLIPKSRFGEGTGYFNLTTTLTMAISPALGLYLIQHYSFQVMFLVSLSLVMVSTMLAFFIKYREIVPLKPLRLELFEKKAFSVTMTIFLIAMSYGSILSFLALYAAQQGIANIGPFFTVYAIALFITRPLVGRWSDKYGFKVIIIPGTIVVAMAMFLLYSAHSLSDFLWSGICYGLGFGAVFPSLQAMAVIAAPLERRGAANGTFFTGFDLGISVSSVVCGLIAQTAGYRVMYLGTVIPVFIALIFFVIVEEE